MYLSRKLLSREVAYATVEKECLAIVWTLKKRQQYLYRHNLIVVTYHDPLSWLHREDGDNGKLATMGILMDCHTRGKLWIWTCEMIC